ncbi:MAG: SAM-dependent chlorinase/fluorinase [Nitrososphaerota archaeon]
MTLGPSNRRLVAFMTDYGLRDTYVAQVKAVILSYRIDTVIIDVTHEVEPFNELEAAFLLTTYVQYMPPGTIHLCIIDPYVGGMRKPIIIQTSRGDLFVGPDTGVMIPAAEQLGIVSAYEIDESNLPRRTGETFHGRDVFAHVVGMIVSDVPLSRLGRELVEYRKFTLPNPVKREDYIEATVLHVDRFGNIITNLKPLDIGIVFTDIIEISTFTGLAVNCPFVKTYSEVVEGSFLTTIGGSGYIEISRNMGSANEELRLRAGDKIKVRVVKNI